MKQRYTKGPALGFRFGEARALKDTDEPATVFVGIDGTPGSILISGTAPKRATKRSATRRKAGEPKAPVKVRKVKREDRSR